MKASTVRYLSLVKKEFFKNIGIHKKAFAFRTRSCHPANKVGWNIAHLAQLGVHMLHQGVPLGRRKGSELPRDPNMPTFNLSQPRAHAASTLLQLLQIEVHQARQVLCHIRLICILFHTTVLRHTQNGVIWAHLLLLLHRSSTNTVLQAQPDRGASRKAWTNSRVLRRAEISCADNKPLQKELRNRACSA